MPDGEPLDDAALTDDEYVLRVVPPVFMEMSDDGALLLTSGAFQDITDQRTGQIAMSVFVESRLSERGASADDLVSGLDGYGVVAFRVATLRSHGFGVTLEPNDLMFSHAHAHVNGQKKRSIRKRLVLEVEYRVWPAPHPTASADS